MLNPRAQGTWSEPGISQGPKTSTVMGHWDNLESGDSPMYSNTKWMWGRASLLFHFVSEMHVTVLLYSGLSVLTGPAQTDPLAPIPTLEL